MKIKKLRYPGEEEAEQIKDKNFTNAYLDREPDFIGNRPCPNYAKFERKGWDDDKILVWLNVD